MYGKLKEKAKFSRYSEVLVITGARYIEAGLYRSEVRRKMGRTMARRNWGELCVPRDSSAEIKKKASANDSKNTVINVLSGGMGEARKIVPLRIMSFRVIPLLRVAYDGSRTLDLGGLCFGADMHWHLRRSNGMCFLFLDGGGGESGASDACAFLGRMRLPCIQCGYDMPDNEKCAGRDSPCYYDCIP